MKAKLIRSIVPGHGFCSAFSSGNNYTQDGGTGSRSLQEGVMYLGGLKRGGCERRSSVKRAGGGVPGGGSRGTGREGAVNFLSLKSCNMRSVGQCPVLRFARHCPGLLPATLCRPVSCFTFC